MAPRGEEIQRKILHVIFGAVIPAGILYLPAHAATQSWLPRLPGWWYPSLILAAVLISWLTIEVARVRVPFVRSVFTRYFGSMLRQEESTRITGATYIMASSLICSVVFRHRPAIAAMALALFIWGDAAAALIGQSIGRTKIGAKSLEGSLACFALCLAMFFALFPFVPGLLAPWAGKVPVVPAIAVSLCVTVLELVPLRVGKDLVVNDNLVVPVVAGLLMWALAPAG